jgi:hypothetical protein
MDIGTMVPCPKCGQKSEMYWDTHGVEKTALLGRCPMCFYPLSVMVKGNNLLVYCTGKMEKGVTYLPYHAGDEEVYNYENV